MALQINGTTVVDNSRNLTNVNGYYGNGVATQSEAEAGTGKEKPRRAQRKKTKKETNMSGF